MEMVRVRIDGSPAFLVHEEGLMWIHGDDLPLVRVSWVSWG